MSWNGSNASGNANPAAKPASSPKSTGTSHGLLAGLIVIVLGLAAVWFFVLKDKAPAIDKSDVEANGPDGIAEVNPAGIASNANANADGTVEIGKNGKPKRKPVTYVDENGVERYVGGARVPRKKKNLVTFPDRRAVKWKFNSEDEISTLIEMEPGDTIVGDEVYGEKFVEDFKKSLAEPIEIKDDDHWYVKKLKEDMIAAKQDLKEAMERGEDIAKIMTDSRRELRQLYEYREEVLSQVHALKKTEGYTTKDVDDLVGAANKMLESKGIAPIKLPRTFYRKLTRQGWKDKNNGNNGEKE